MPTPKQTELINELMLKLNDDEKLLCTSVIDYLLELGYTAKKRKKSVFTIEFEKYGRIIAKMEHGVQYKTDPAPYLRFSLRFSACDHYSKVFQDAVNRRPRAWIERGQYWQPRECYCGVCKGKPRFYHYTRDDGTTFDDCGGYTKQVPGVTSGDVPEILRMIKEQDAHFHEMLNYSR